MEIEACEDTIKKQEHFIKECSAEISNEEEKIENFATIMNKEQTESAAYHDEAARKTEDCIARISKLEEQLKSYQSSIEQNKRILEELRRQDDREEAMPAAVEINVPFGDTKGIKESSTF